MTQEIKDLFRKVRTKCGAPVRKIQLEDDQLCDLLEVSIGDYAEKVQNFVIQSQWTSLYGKNVMNAEDMAFAISTRTLDFSRDYSYWFSREVGLQQRGPWELKKDFFQVEKGKQCYVIPSGREINKVMYVTPSTTKAALYGNMGMLDTGMGGGFAQYGNLGNGMGLTGFYIGSAYDSVLMAADLKYKNSLLRGDLSYKVTAGPDGTHIVHLLSVPGSKNMIGGIAADDSWGWSKYHNCYVWYTYYDVTGKEDEIDDCRLANKNDILISPDQVPLEKMRYELLNAPTQETIRNLLTAEAMITLALIRGTFSGKVTIPEAELNMDYSIFKELGTDLKNKTMEALDKRLESLLPWNMMKNMSDMTDSLIGVLKNKPLGIYIKG